VAKNIAAIAVKDQALPVPNVIQHLIQIMIRCMLDKCKRQENKFINLNPDEYEYTKHPKFL